jgi:hypothetical protein
MDEERGDLDMQRRVWAGEGNPMLEALPRYSRLNTNCFGKHSHATAPAYASADPGAGYIDSGIKNAKPLTSAMLSTTPTVTYTHNEGAHERASVFVFQVGLTAAQAATISSAVLYCALASQGVNQFAGRLPMPHKDGTYKWAWKIYGVAEDDFHPERETQPNGYDWTMMTEAYHHIPYKCFAGQKDPNLSGLNGRFYLADSLACYREHTVAVTAWEWPFSLTAPGFATQGSAAVPPPGGTTTAPWTSPDITEIIKEICGRPGWVAGNRIALVFAPDGIWNDMSDTMIAVSNQDYPSDPNPALAAQYLAELVPLGFNHDYFVNAGTDQPQFQMAQVELRITVP